MSSIIPKNDKSNKPKGNRRRKKRRTEDFSDSSDSSESSSSSEDENEKTHDGLKKVPADDNIEDDDIVLSDDELNTTKTSEVEAKIANDIKLKLKTINLTKTALNDSIKNVNINEVSNALKSSKKDLEDGFLGLMFENYGDDINNLRTAPDFNERSLSILANVLKNGSNIFDQDTLKAVVNK